MRNLLFIIPIICSLLCGCIPLAVTAVGGTAIYERKAIQKHFSDREISFSINNKIFGDRLLYGNNHIVINVLHGDVLVTGQVLTQAYRQQVIDIAKHTEGVKRVYDQLTIGKPASFSRSTEDAIISTKIRTQIVGSDKVGSGVSITTEDGVVYLMGTVTPQESDAATDIARRTNGVTRVVKIFRYITQSE